MAWPWLPTPGSQRQHAWQNDSMRFTQDHRQDHGTGDPMDGLSAFPYRGADRTGPIGSGVRHAVPAAVACVALVAILSGCVGGTTSADPSSDGEPASQSATAGAGQGTAAASTASSAPPTTEGAGAGATETVRQSVTDALGRLAAAAPKPATAQVTDALVGAGIDPAALEVSQSRTPTGLDADAIEAAVRQGGDCVIGQVREGAVTVMILPVLASGKCFVGS